MPAEIVTRSQHTITITTSDERDRIEVRTTSDGGACVMVGDPCICCRALTRDEAKALAVWLTMHFPQCGSGDQI